MTRHVNGSRRRTTADRLENGGRLPGTVAAEHSLVTTAWTRDVETVETAIRQFAAGRDLTSNCRVMLFEMAGDADLHVNVIHAFQKRTVGGWAGPGQVASEFVYNRRFGDVPPNQIIRDIREMVFADPRFR